MFGVLLDVSASMEEAFAIHYDKRGDLTEDKVKRSHGIITTLNNIVNQEITTYERKDLVFATAFGLHPKAGVDTCDFIALLRKKKEIDETLDRWEKQYSNSGHKILIEFAKRKNAPHAEPWIKEKLKQKDAGILWETLKDDDQLTKKILDLIPAEGTYESVKLASNVGYGTKVAGFGLAGLGVVLAPFTGGASLALMGSGGAMAAAGYEGEKRINNAADKHEALELARDTVTKKISKETDLKTILQKMQNVKPYAIKDVSNLLDALLQKNKEASSSRVHETIDSIKPYIYGRTPMVKALREAKGIFDGNPEINPKVLFILSDGMATDEDLGDPTSITQELQNSNVTIVTCYFTSQPIPNPKCLVDEEDSSWDEGACVLYNMSSTIPNTNAPVTHLIDYDWDLPLSGQCHLFLQANSLDVVEEFCKVVVSHLTHGTDALVHMLGRLSLDTYINQSNDDFKAQQQIGATCYANATAAVFHLAMNRIVGREIPKFKTIRGRIIREYGKEGANTGMVIEKVCPEYRLRCHKKVCEKCARQALNERRPSVARFSWKREQEEKFKKYYERSPKGILRASDIAVEGTAMSVL